MTGPRQSIPEFPPNEEYGEHWVGTDAAERQSWASISRRIGESDLFWLATTRPTEDRMPSRSAGRGTRIACSST